MSSIRILSIPAAGTLPKAGEVTVLYRGKGATPSQYIVPPDIPLPPATDLAAALVQQYSATELAELVKGLSPHAAKSEPHPLHC